jgi:hypothetical protein
MRRGPSILRALAAGAPAGVVGGLVLGVLLARRGVSPHNAVLALLGSVVAGCGFGLLVRRRNPAEGLFLGVAYGAFGWWLGPLTVLPLATGQPLAWSLAAAQRQFAGLLGFLLYGAATGLAYAALRGRKARLLPGALLRGLLAGSLVALVLQVPGSRAVGPLIGLAQALEAPQPTKGLGAALIRGRGYGFLAWVAVLGGGPRWSVEQARSSFPTLLACLLLGMAVAVLRQPLDAIAGLFSAERLRTWRPVPVDGGPAGAALHGAAAGLLGAAALTLLPMAVTLGTPVPPLVTLGAAGGGLGLLYGLLFRRLDLNLTTAIGWGLSCGFLWWVIGPLTLLPLLEGRGGRWSAVEAAGAFATLPALLLFGTCVGLAFHLLQTRHRRPWPAGREPVIAGLGLLVPLVMTIVLVLAEV